MTVKFNLPGAKRKQFAETTARWLGAEMKYLGAPTFAYKVGNLEIQKDGTVVFSDGLDAETVERLLEFLYDESFEAESLPENEEAESCNLEISIPIEKVEVENLTKLLETKGELIKKALGIASVEFKVSEDKVTFPWFKQLTPDESKAYITFITELCSLTKKQKRINTTEKIVENEKYAFRCFLLRLGFIGSEHKETRKILLKNLEGSSAFKGGAAK